MTSKIIYYDVFDDTNNSIYEHLNDSWTKYYVREYNVKPIFKPSKFASKLYADERYMINKLNKFNNIYYFWWLK